MNKAKILDMIVYTAAGGRVSHALIFVMCWIMRLITVRYLCIFINPTKLKYMK